MVGQNDRQVLVTVPRLYVGAAGAASRDGGWNAALARLRGNVGVGLVVAGLLATAAWGAFLAWCVFSLVRWTIG